MTPWIWICNTHIAFNFLYITPVSAAFALAKWDTGSQMKGANIANAGASQTLIYEGKWDPRLSRAPTMEINPKLVVWPGFKGHWPELGGFDLVCRIPSVKYSTRTDIWGRKWYHGTVDGNLGMGRMRILSVKFVIIKYLIITNLLYWRSWYVLIWGNETSTRPFCPELWKRQDWSELD